MPAVQLLFFQSQLPKWAHRPVLYFPKIQFEIISKNILDIDDRDIVNNLKGYMKNHCTESNFIYLTDEKNAKETHRENLWLGTAFSSNPIFNNNENYLFIS